LATSADSKQGAFWFDPILGRFENFEEVSFRVGGMIAVDPGSDELSWKARWDKDDPGGFSVSRDSLTEVGQRFDP